MLKNWISLRINRPASRGWPFRTWPLFFFFYFETKKPHSLLPWLLSFQLSGRSEKLANIIFTMSHCPHHFNPHLFLLAWDTTGISFYYLLLFIKTKMRPLVKFMYCRTKGRFNLQRHPSYVALVWAGTTTDSVVFEDSDLITVNGEEI